MIFVIFFDFLEHGVKQTISKYLEVFLKVQMKHNPRPHPPSPFFLNIGNNDFVRVTFWF